MPNKSKKVGASRDVNMFHVRFMAFLQQQKVGSKDPYVQGWVDALENLERDAHQARIAGDVHRVVLERFTPMSFADIEALAEEQQWSWEDAMNMPTRYSEDDDQS